MHVQSLLFSRDAHWTVERAKAWAKSHGYKSGKVDVTDKYIRLRQEAPGKTGVKRTITFGQGIRAVVGRAETSSSPRKEAMAGKRRRSKRSKHTTKRRRKARASAPAAAAPRRHRRRRARAAAPVAAAPRRRRRRARVTAAAPRRRRARPRRRSRARAWYGQRKRHSTTARKGHRRRRRAAPRRRRRARESMEMYAPRRRHGRRRHHHHRGHALANPMSGGEMALAFLAGGVGWAIADFTDRYLATYDPTVTPPAGSAAPAYFTGGNGTMANTLNNANLNSSATILRIGVGVGLTALPFVGAYFVKNNLGRAALQGMGLGAGISLFGKLWNTYVMAGLLAPAAGAGPNLGTRLYPAEIVAKQNLAASPVAQTVGGSGFTPLAAPPQQQYAPPPQQRQAPPPQRQAAPPPGVAAPPQHSDPGPFAVHGIGLEQPATPLAPIPPGVAPPAYPPEQQDSDNCTMLAGPPKTANGLLGDQLPSFLGFMAGD